MRPTLKVMLAQFKISIIGGLQYRLHAGLNLLGLLVESVIYLVVWTTIALAQGGEVGGYTAGEFSGYFIAWTFVRNITTGWSPWAIEWRIRRGEFNALLLRPIHPYFFDMGEMMGDKMTANVLLLPTIALMVLAFRPEFTLVPWALVALLPILALAFLLRYTLMYALAITAFWTTRVTALFELWFALEFFTSGRIAPLTVLPEWAQQIAYALPFQWMFYFPLELLLGRRTPEEALTGAMIQILWLIATVIVFRLVWRAAVRRYAAVGG